MTQPLLVLNWVFFLELLSARPHRSGPCFLIISSLSMFNISSWTEHSGIFHFPLAAKVTLCPLPSAICSVGAEMVLLVTLWTRSRLHGMCHAEHHQNREVQLRTSSWCLSSWRSPEASCTRRHYERRDGKLEASTKPPQAHITYYSGERVNPISGGFPNA